MSNFNFEYYVRNVTAWQNVQRNDIPRECTTIEPRFYRDI